MRHLRLVLPILCLTLASCGENAPEQAPEMPRELGSLHGHSIGVAALAWAGDNRHLASGAYDAELRLWQIPKRGLSETRLVHKNHVRAVDVSADGEYLLSGGGNPEAFLWKLPEMKLIHKLAGHEETISIRTKNETNRISAVDFAPDGRTGITASWDGTIKRWNLETGELVQTYQGHAGRVHCAAHSPDGNRIASGSAKTDPESGLATTGELQVREAESGKVLWTKSPFKSFVTMVAFPPDGEMVIAASYFDPGPVKAFETKTGKELPLFAKMSCKVTSLAMTPSGKYLLTGGRDGSVRWYSMETGAEIARIEAMSSPVDCMALRRDGVTLAVGGGQNRNEGIIKLWHLPERLR